MRQYGADYSQGQRRWRDFAEVSAASIKKPGGAGLSGQGRDNGSDSERQTHALINRPLGIQFGRHVSSADNLDADAGFQQWALQLT